jgi:sulfoacetaldehyde dehydrogenase
MQTPGNAAEYVAALFERARAAQRIANEFTQERVDELTAAIAWAIVKPENSEKISRLAIDESGLGYYEAKYVKLQKKVRGTYRDMKYAKTVGVIETDTQLGLIKLAKPVGVIGAIVPCTNPEATPSINILGAIKCRNAIIFSPHPRTKKTNALVCDIVRDVLKRHGAPEDLVISIEEPTLEISTQVMKQCDLVVATGGSGLVKAAYSSGTPAWGVGAGNAVVVVDEDADIQDAAHKIMLSKTFDYATSCSSDNAAIILSSIYDKTMQALTAEGGYLCSPEEKALLQKTMFPDGHLNTRLTAQAPDVIAKAAGISLPEGSRFLMVEETGAGPAHPFSDEKLSVILTVYRADTLDEAIDLLNAIHEFKGKGHSCGIHGFNEEHILRLAERTYTSRIMVRQPVCFGNSGDWVNGMPFTLSLGCGTWGNNMASENITYKHFMNTTWVSSPIPECVPDDRELFGESVMAE